MHAQFSLHVSTFLRVLVVAALSGFRVTVGVVEVQGEFLVVVQGDALSCLDLLGASGLLCYS